MAKEGACEDKKTEEIEEELGINAETIEARDEGKLNIRWRYSSKPLLLSPFWKDAISLLFKRTIAYNYVFLKKTDWKDLNLALVFVC